jgi:GNAT superfamily N-acetyltransferase
MQIARHTTVPVPLSFAAYQRRYRQPVRDLLHHNENVHLHLDWHDSDAWIDGEGGTTWLAFQGTRLVGLAAVSEPMDKTCWLRIAAVDDHRDPMEVLPPLWSALAAHLRAAGVTQTAALLLNPWIEPYLSALGFGFMEEIITLRRSSFEPPPEPLPDGVRIRTAQPDDLAAVAALDRCAFSPPWQMSEREIRQAVRVTAYATIAEIGRRLIGYQLSTVYFDGAHLARLAVAPEAQGRGVGTALVAGAIRYFQRRSLTLMTVNTQLDNTRSQEVYLRLGFRRNGYDLPVWTAVP